MFGILFGLFGVFGKIGNNINCKIHDANESEKAKHTFNRTFLDSKGKDRYVKNNRWVHINQRNGDLVLEDVLNKEIYINYSKETKNSVEEQSKLKARQEGKIAYLYMSQAERTKKKDGIPYNGDLYKDVFTGAIYAVLRRYVDHDLQKGIVELYIDVKTNKFICKSDNQINVFDTVWKNKYNSYIDDAVKYINAMATRKEWSEEEYNRRLEAQIIKNKKYILSQYIPDELMYSYLEKVNAIQYQYIINDDDMAYYSFKKRR